MIKVNTSIIPHCSKGVQRYYNEIITRLNVDYKKSNVFECFFRGFLSVAGYNSVLWTPGQGGSFISSNHVVTCHDVIDFSFYSASLKNQIKKRLHKLIYSKAKKIVFISEATKNDFNKVFPDIHAPKVVIRSPINVEPKFLYNGDVYSFYKLKKKRFFISITNSMPHKNNGAFINAINSIKDSDVKGVIVGSLNQSDIELIKDTNRFILLNRLDDSELFSLVVDSCGLVSSSFIEGHNLTLAEALSVGANIVASNIDVHREFYSGFAHFFNPYEFHELTLIMMKLLEHPEFVYRLDKRLLRSWEHVASDYQNLFKM